MNCAFLGLNQRGLLITKYILNPGVLPSQPIDVVTEHCVTAGADTTHDVSVGSDKSHCVTVGSDRNGT